MNMISSFIILILLLSPVAAEESLVPSPIQTKVVSKTVAVVNNEPIFEEELQKEADPFIERYAKSTPEKEQSPEKITELKNEILNRMIEEKLLFQEAKSKKVRVTKVEIERGIEQFKEPFMVDEEGKQRQVNQVEKAFQDQLKKEGMTQEQFNKRVEEQIMKVKLIEQDVKSKVEMPKEEEVRKFFDRIQKKMKGQPVENLTKEEENDLAQITKYLERMTGAQVRIRHILIRTMGKSVAEKIELKKKLEEVALRIKNGEDFAFLAKKFSEDPLSKDRGGDLGFVAKGDMGLPQIDEKVFLMKEGELSGIIETDLGYHLVKCIEKKSPHPIEYEDISEDLKNYTAQRYFTQKLEKYIKDLRAKASIKINL